ncbi:MAG: hypothetical protein EA397_20365 [Deltaproteobacteria bacterium]|nr:MAG: hypothetical protein EA397_20365 [Deltaproteobacteria bacterium]
MLCVDFGTSRVKVAYLQPSSGQVQLMQLGEGSRAWIPSLFYFGSDGQILLGDRAASQRPYDPAGVLSNLKRTLRDSSIRTSGQRRPPLKLLTLLFEEIRSRAERELPSLRGSVDEVVLTHPAAFSVVEDDLFVSAAKAAGFRWVHRVPEPVSAASAWRHQVAAVDGADVLVVLDCGGGTADWTCLAAKETGFEIVGECPPGGDDRLGGGDLDEALLGLVRDDLRAQGRAEALDELERADVRYVSEIRMLKERFCENKSFSSHDVLTFVDGPYRFSADAVHGAIHSRLFLPLTRSFGHFLESVREQAGVVRPSVLLVGGSRQVLGLSEAVSELGCDVVGWDRAEFATVLGGVYVGLEALGRTRAVAEAQGAAPAASARGPVTGPLSPSEASSSRAAESEASPSLPSKAAATSQPSQRSIEGPGTPSRASLSPASSSARPPPSHASGCCRSHARAVPVSCCAVAGGLIVRAGVGGRVGWVSFQAIRRCGSFGSARRGRGRVCCFGATVRSRGRAGSRFGYADVVVVVCRARCG